MSITSLGYVGFRVRDPGAWSAFATEVLGVMESQPSGLGRRFRVDQQAWRLALEEGPEDDIAFLGLETAGPEALARLAERLRAAGVAVETAGSELLDERRVFGLVSCHDPEGLRVEVYYGPCETRETPFVSPVGVDGFVTGEQGLGHVVLTTSDIGKSRAFYQDILGFRLSDIIRMRFSPEFALDLEFYHCNPRHHTLALVPSPAPKRLHHFMLQTARLDDVGLALDRAETAGAPIAQTLGRHTNDQMVSFYAVTPAGFQVEYGWGACEVDEAWRVVRHDKTSVWGHKHAGVD